MKLDTLKDYIQSANINFLIGSGLSRPYLSTLGNIENVLAALNINTSIDERMKNIIAASVYKKYFEEVMQPNHSNNIPAAGTKGRDNYEYVYLNTRHFFSIGL